MYVFICIYTVHITYIYIFICIYIFIYICIHVCVCIYMLYLLIQSKRVNLKQDVIDSSNFKFVFQLLMFQTLLVLADHNLLIGHPNCTVMTLNTEISLQAVAQLAACSRCLCSRLSLTLKTKTQHLDGQLTRSDVTLRWQQKRDPLLEKGGGLGISASTPTAPSHYSLSQPTRVLLPSPHL